MKNSIIRIQTKGLQFQYRDRKRKKRLFSRLFIQRINSSLLNNNYSNFVNLLKIQKIKLNKKILSNLVITEPLSFNNLFNFVNSKN